MLEKERIDSVRSFLDLPLSEEKELSDFVYLASQICDTPIASITFIDDLKQHPIIGFGNIVESTCDIAFCNHAIQSTTLFQVTDASKDPAFANNPLVTGEPYIKFYAGIPLVASEGNIVGTLCVIDQQPKKLSQAQERSLTILASQVMRRLEIIRTTHQIKKALEEGERNRELLEQAEIFQSAFFEQCDDYFLLLDRDYKIVSFNRACSDFFNNRNFGIPLEIQNHILNYVVPSNKDFVTATLDEAIAGKTTTFEILANPNSDNAFWNKFTVSPSYNVKGDLIGAACIGCNIDESKKQVSKIEVQKSALSQIAQLHSHQIRHPLTNILGIISLAKLDDFEMTKEYIGYLEKASTELDNVIRNVVITSHNAA